MIHVLLLLLSLVLMVIITFCSIKFSFKLKSKKPINALLIIAAVAYLTGFIIRYMTRFCYVRDASLLFFDPFSSFYRFSINSVTLLLPALASIFLCLCFNNKIKCNANTGLAITLICFGISILSTGDVIKDFWSPAWVFHFSLRIIAAVLSIVSAILLWIKNSKCSIVSSIAISSYALPTFYTKTLIYHEHANLDITGESGFSYYECIDISSIIFSAALFLAAIAILFALKNSNIAVEKPVKSDLLSSPESELKLLKEKLESGVITEEEFAAQRAEIISKL